MWSLADAETFISALKAHFDRLEKACAPCSEEWKICVLQNGLSSSSDNFGSELVDLSDENYTFVDAAEILRWCLALDGTNPETRGFRPRALISLSKEADIVCSLCHAKIHRVASCPKLRGSQKALGPVSYTNDTGNGLP